MRKNVSWLRHFSILFLTVIIFTIGIFIGGNVEEARVQNLYTQLQQQDLDFQNLVTQENYLDYLISMKEKGNGDIDCSEIKDTYYRSIESLDSSRLKLEAYINKGNVKEEEFARLKEHYSNLQINYWILANRINNLCENTNMNTVLYFYQDNKECPSCEDQGVYLSYVKGVLGDDVLIFALDAQKAGAISLLVKNYDLVGQEFPIMIINEKVYKFMEDEEIFEVLCENGLVSEKVCTE